MLYVDCHFTKTFKSNKSYTTYCSSKVMSEKICVYRDQFCVKWALSNNCVLMCYSCCCSQYSFRLLKLGKAARKKLSG